MAQKAVPAAPTPVPKKAEAPPTKGIANPGEFCNLPHPSDLLSKKLFIFLQFFLKATVIANWLRAIKNVPHHVLRFPIVPNGKRWIHRCMLCRLFQKSLTLNSWKFWCLTMISLYLKIMIIIHLSYPHSTPRLHSIITKIFIMLYNIIHYIYYFIQKKTLDSDTWTITLKSLLSFFTIV